MVIKMGQSGQNCLTGPVIVNDCVAGPIIDLDAADKRLLLQIAGKKVGLTQSHAGLDQVDPKAVAALM